MILKALNWIFTFSSATSNYSPSLQDIKNGVFHFVGVLDTIEVYFQVKVEWTQQLVATQKQRTERIRKETENMKAILDAERGRQVEAIKTTQHIEQEEGRANVTRIKNEVFEEKRRMEADVSSYVAASEANSNKELLTDNYIKLQLGQLLSNNTKMFFSGPDSVLGSVLQKVFTPSN